MINYGPSGGPVGAVTKVVIGKGDDCDIVVTDDPYVSARHCELTRQADGSWTLTDYSTNGTHVRGRLYPSGFRLALGVATLRAGDVITVGRTELPPFTPDGS